MKRGLVWSIAATAVGAIGSLTITPLLIRSLGAGEYGLYLLVLTVASYGGFFDFGLTWAATRYFAQDLAADDSNRLASRFRTLELFLLMVACACLGAAVSIGPWLMRASGAEPGWRLSAALALGAASFGLTLEAQLHASLLRAAQQFHTAGRAAALGSVLLPLGSFTAVRFAPELLPLLAINLAVNLAVLVVYSRESRRWLGRGPVVRPELAYLREMAAFGGWSTVSRVVLILMLQVDRLAVALVGSVTGLTYYAVPANLAGRINVIGGPAASLFFARASSLFAGGDRAALVRQHARAIRFLAWVAGALTLPLVALGPDFLRVWIGPEMAVRGGPVLIAFAIGYALISVSSVDAVTIEASGLVQLTAKNMLFWAVPAFAGVILFAGRYGSPVVAAAISGWLACTGLTNMVICRRRVAVGSRFPLLGVALSAAAAWAAAVPLRPLVTGIPSCLAAMSVAGGAALLTGFVVILEPQDRALVLATAGRPFEMVRRRAAGRLSAYPL